MTDPAARAPGTPFTIVGQDDAAVCVDGVCALPGIASDNVPETTTGTDTRTAPAPDADQAHEAESDPPA